MYRHLPRQRRLDPEHLAKVEELIKLKPNKKLLTVQLQEMTGKAVTLRDMTNIACNMNKSSNHNDVVKLVQRLNSIPG